MSSSVGWVKTRMMSSSVLDFIYLHIVQVPTNFLSGTSVFTKVYEVDIRKSSLNIDSLEFIQSSITNLPFGDCTINSLSCLHVAGHIGLGRYGDNIDINGTKKAVEELQRTFAKNDNLFFSVPIGKDSIYFNTHRIFSVKTIQSLFY